ncbi:MAG: DUF3592 domain-containing protein [Desulfobacteraceae bacterium]|jgi:hypothetical protein|nr:DUF3592 domain-containing protein [Desulfobacteraceae bacterium]
MDTSEKNTPVTGAEANSGKNLGIMTLAMFAVGIFLMSWAGYEMKGAAESRAWPEAQGSITSSHVSKETSRDSEQRLRTTYYPNVAYQYQIAGRGYTGTRINFGGRTGGMEWVAQRTVDRYPAGKIIIVHYNPQEPTYAVLEAGITWGLILLFLMGVVFIAAGVLCFKAYRKNRQKQLSTT